MWKRRQVFKHKRALLLYLLHGYMYNTSHSQYRKNSCGANKERAEVVERLNDMRVSGGDVGRRDDKGRRNEEGHHRERRWSKRVVGIRWEQMAENESWDWIFGCVYMHISAPQQGSRWMYQNNASGKNLTCYPLILLKVPLSICSNITIIYMQINTLKFNLITGELCP